MKHLLSESCKHLNPYEVKKENPREDGIIPVKMDANESPYPLPKAVLSRGMERIRTMDFQLYPDTDSTVLRASIASFINRFPEEVLVGTGSDEVIQILLNTFLNSKDVVVSHSPTFPMYGIFTETQGGTYRKVPSLEGFRVDIDGIIKTANEEKAKMIFLCTPNNPTGTVIPKEDVIRVLRKTDSMVVVDEAYGEFAEADFLNLIKDPAFDLEKEELDRLVILRTFSKAYGMASLRCGFAVGSKKTISYLNRVKPPYNLNKITQIFAEEMMEYCKTPEGKAEMDHRIHELIREREKFNDFLGNLPGITVFPSESNFLCFSRRKTGGKFPGEDPLYLDRRLEEKGFLIKYLFQDSEHCYYRFSFGLPEENKGLKTALKELIEEYAPAPAVVKSPNPGEVKEEI